jgi:hypothetical protein
MIVCSELERVGEEAFVGCYKVPPLRYLESTEEKP